MKSPSTDTSFLLESINKNTILTIRRNVTQRCNFTGAKKTNYTARKSVTGLLVRENGSPTIVIKLTGHKKHLIT
jgi:hypothetical protein